MQGEILEQEQKTREQMQDNCTHLKGGILINYAFSNGTDEQYAVCKHQLPLGDYIVKCLRCGKKWIQPKREDFKAQFAFEAAYIQYREAVDFPTDNKTSTSIQFQVFKKSSVLEVLKLAWSVFKRDVNVVKSIRELPGVNTFKVF
jgi:hypothetical protein